MLNEKVVKLLNSQINKEFYSAYLYLDMANYYAKEGLSGFENWFVIQAQEERDHAMLFRQYLLNNGHEVKFEAIADPSKEYKGYKEPLEAALAHEQYVTDSINKIYDAAMEVKDYRTRQFLDWFVKEQGEEEMNAEDNIRKFVLAGDGKGLFLLDQHFQARTYAAPSLVLD
ncbi:ferritin [Pleomorphochaeta sp. DL1XJH-081]|jgi:ferritin|uniref:ferritin n=1 Tax=Pleomorphochaeta sp. DL1XJH-081 TaxID=3409690 RepID=UPI003BB52F8C